MLAAAGTRPPNILLILADDIGLNGFGCYGADRFKGRTPNIDALAATGARFEQVYSMPTCNPTRCVLMTGRYTAAKDTAGEPSKRKNKKPTAK